MQSEPTAEARAASAGQADACGGVGGEPLDPAETAELRKLADRLSRCRQQPPDEEADDDAYD